MREILFRGKTAKGEWVYGCLLNDKHDRIGFYNNAYKFEINAVIPETVGQFTGVTDKNGKKIFEGDIVKCDVWLFEKKGVVEFGRGTFDSGIYKYTGFYLREANGEIDHNPIYNFDEEYENCLVVIGNIHDNPELLEGVRDGD